MLSTISETMREIVKTPEGAFAMFLCAFGGVLVLGMLMVAITDKDFHHMLSELLLGGIKCKSCKKRPKKWIMWHQREGETEYTGYDWCPFCGVKRYEGFQDRVF